jgi:hypothetical protein
MAEGARAIWGLAEWSLAAVGLPEHLRFLAGFSPAQRQRAMSREGLPFAEMSVAQQERYLFLAFGDEGRPPQAALLDMRLRVLENHPGLRPDAVPAEAQLAFAYESVTPNVQVSVTYVATERGCEVHRQRGRAVERPSEFELMR